MIPAQSIRRVGRISPDEFMTAFVRRRRPVILEGHLDGWNLSEPLTPDALSRRFGEVPVLAVMFDRLSARARTRLHRSATLVEMSLAQCVAAVGDANGSSLCALAGYPLARISPALLSEFPAPAVTHCIADAAPFIWLGPEGKVVPLHHDRADGILAQAFGVKEICLISPETGSAIVPMPDNPFLGRIPEEGPYDPQMGAAGERLPSLRGELHPGDVIFIPQGWWHSIRYVTTSISINYWPSSYLLS